MTTALICIAAVFIGGGVAIALAMLRRVETIGEEPSRGDLTLSTPWITEHHFTVKIATMPQPSRYEDITADQIDRMKYAGLPMYAPTRDMVAEMKSHIEGQRVVSK